MDYHKKTLSNGLRVITIPMPQAESVTLTVWVNVGSRYEPDKIGGLSHFLEHIVFKGSKKRPTAKEISTAVDAIGGEFNAGTSKEWTNFYIKASKKHIETAFDVLSDMVFNPLIREDEIEREKGVILEEMAMYEDTPMMNIGDVFESKMFEGNFLGRDTIGTEKSVKSLTKDDFLRYRSAHYFPKNLLITVAGGVKESEVIKLTEKYFKELPKQEGTPSGKTKFSHTQSSPDMKLKSKKIEQAHLILGFRGNPLGHPDRYTEAILSTILGKGMSSRLFIEVRERRGLAYSVRTDADHYTDAGYIGTYAGVDPSKAEEAIKVTLDEHYKLASGESPISASELTKAKEYLKGHIALSLENTSAVNQFFGEQELLQKKIETPDEIFKEIDKVTIEDVIRVAKKLFKKENLNLGIIGPYNNEDKFKKLLN
ncbi:MAG TPA: pitrilysin family protein [Candidatus Saccharimonadales bacterium]|nr:pitrilysin family protein [Candidatus Saccharimonadales bacterium]